VRQRFIPRVQVGPFANPNEVYNFYSLPYCAPAELEFRREDLGALMKGDRATKTLYLLRFMGGHPPQHVANAMVTDTRARGLRVLPSLAADQFCDCAVPLSQRMLHSVLCARSAWVLWRRRVLRQRFWTTTISS
jgi:hypothetical protein